MILFSLILLVVGSFAMGVQVVLLYQQLVRKADIEAICPALEPRDSTSSPSDIGRVANIDVNGSAEFDWPEPLAKGD